MNQFLKIAFAAHRISTFVYYFDLKMSISFLLEVITTWQNTRNFTEMTGNPFQKEVGYHESIASFDDFHSL